MSETPTTTTKEPTPAQATAAAAIKDAAAPAPTPPVVVPPKAEPIKDREGAIAEHFTESEIALIRNGMMKGATDDEVGIFIYVCKKTGLNPFVRQIYPVKRRSQVDGQWIEKWVYQVGIDGFRLIAERTGQYQGSTEPEFFDAAGNSRKIWYDKKPPHACRVGIRRKGWPEPQFVTVLWDEYAQRTSGGGVTAMWSTKGTVMISKCAEAIGLRKAFPQELSGLYVAEELMRDEPSEEITPEAVKESRARIAAAASEILADGDAVLNFGRFTNRKVSTLTLEEIEKTFLSAWADPQRRQNAIERIGASLVTLIEQRAEHLKAEAREKAARPYELPERIARICAVSKEGRKLAPDAQDELRKFVEDHPEAEEAVRDASTPDANPTPGDPRS